MDKKIKVCNSLEEIIDFLQKHKDLKICLYLADKTLEEWEKSTSRVYMNKINEKFIYLPFNIKKDDRETIKKVYELSEKSNQIVAINQTQPHKSNPILKEWFAHQNIPTNVDSLIKDKYQKLTCYNLNGPSFTGWFEDEVGTFENKRIIIFGVGGVGEPIAREIINKAPKKLYLIDILSKEKLAQELLRKREVCYAKQLSQIDFESNEILLINCAGKEGADDNEIEIVIEKFKNFNNIFVDLRPQLNIDIVNRARELGWNAYTGFGMNARNDYTLLEKIAQTTNIKIPTFTEFTKLVQLAS